MSRLVKVLIGLVVGVVTLYALAGLLIKFTLADDAGETLRSRLERKLPVGISISGGEFDLGAWMRLQPSIAFHGLEVANPPGFSAEPLLRAEEVSARANLLSLFGDQLEVQSVAIEGPRARIETGPEGRTNVQALLDLLGSQSPSERQPEPEPPAETEPGRGVTVESFQIADGSVLYVSNEPGLPDFELHDLNVSIENFRPDDAFDLRLRAEAFRPTAVRLQFEGESGPFTPQSSPAQGQFALSIAPAQLPEELRRRFFGDSLLAPGEGSSLELESDFQGDLLGVLNGNGRLSVAGLQLGQPGQTQLPVEGEAPLMLTLTHPLGNPAVHLTMPEAELKFGSGSWQGGLEVDYDGRRVAGQSAGAIGGVQINEMLAALTSVADVVYGDLAVQKYQVRFEGATADELKRSLDGSAQLEVLNGRLTIFDLLSTIEKQFQKALGGEETASGVTTFVRLAADVEMGGGRVSTPKVALENEAAQIAGAGFIDLENLGLDYDLTSLIQGPLARLLGARETEQEAAQVAVPFEVTGAVGAPRVRVDFKQLLRQQGVEQGKRLLDSLLNKDQPEGEEKKQEKPGLPFDLPGLLQRTLEKEATPKKQ